MFCIADFAFVFGGWRSGNAAFWDAYTNHDHYGDWNPGRVMDLGVNSAVGGLGGHYLQQGEASKALSTFLFSPLKDLIVGGIPAVHKLPGAIDQFTKTLAKPQVSVDGAGGKMDPKTMALALAGGIGVGGLGYLGAKSIAKALRQNSEDCSNGRVSIRLPTKTPNDQETRVDLPIESFNLSPTLIGAIGRDTRRRLRQESKERTWHRDPHGKLLTHGEPLTDDDLAQSIEAMP